MFELRIQKIVSDQCTAGDFFLNILFCFIIFSQGAKQDSIAALQWPCNNKLV